MASGGLRARTLGGQGGPGAVRPVRRGSPMSARRAMAGRRARQAGFSLVEVLVAMVLTGLVMGALALVSAQWLPQWRRGFTRVEAAEQMALALDRVAADLAAAENVPTAAPRNRPLFRGTPSAVIFVRTALGPNVRPGLEVVELFRPAGGGLARRSAAYVPMKGDDALPAFGAPVALLRAGLTVTFSFAGRDGQWVDEWVDFDEFPRGVRAVVRDARTGRTLEASTAVAIEVEVPADCLTHTNRPGCASSAVVLPSGTPDATEGASR